MAAREEIRISLEIETPTFTEKDKKRGYAALELEAKEKGKKLNGGRGYNCIGRGKKGDIYEFYGFVA